MKLRILAAAMAACALGSGHAVAQTAAPRPATAAVSPADKTNLSYAMGFELTDNLSRNKVDVDVAALVRGIQDGYAKRNPTVSREQMKALLDAFQQRMMDQARVEFERMTRENKAKSDSFLASNRSKPGVVVMPSGIQYRILDAGSGAKPTTASTVQLHVRASLAAGQELMSTHGNPTAPSFKMTEFPPVLPPSIKDVLLLMPTGSRWEVVLPPDKAFGNDPRSPVGPAQALVYELKLVSVK